MTADNTQATATKPWPLISEYNLGVEPETDSVLGAPKVTVSVSTSIPAASVVADEWDDTKLESVSQIKTPKLGGDPEPQVRMETLQTAQVTDDIMDGMEGVETLTEAADVTLRLPKRETHMGTTLLTARGDERSSAFTDPSSFTPTSSVEDTKVSVVNLVQNTADFMDSTKEDNAMFFETTVSISEYESEVYQPLGNTFKGKRKKKRKRSFV